MTPTDELLNQLFICFHLTGQFYHKNTAAAVLFRGQGRLLHLLLSHDGCSQRELAELMQIRAASLTELVKKAEAKGAIRREPNPYDRRLSNVFLTDFGRVMANDCSNEGQSLAGEIFATLNDEEQSQLTAILTKLNAHLQSLTGISPNDVMLRRRRTHGPHNHPNEHKNPNQ